MDSAAAAVAALERECAIAHELNRCQLYWFKSQQNCKFIIIYINPYPIIIVASSIITENYYV